MHIPNAPATRSPREAKRSVKTPAFDGPIAKPRRGSESRCVPTLIVDKNALSRAGMVHLLAGTRYRVVADCSRLNDLPERVLNHGLVLVLLGFDRQTEGAFAEVSFLRNQHPNVRVVMLSECLTPEDVPSAIRSGLNGCLIKDQIDIDALLKTLDLAALGSVVVFEGFSQEHPNNSAGQDFHNAVPKDVEELAAGSVMMLREAELFRSRLSPREQATLQHLMRGASNKCIARELGIAEATVKVHVKSLLRKIRANNRTQAAMWGINYLEQNRLASLQRNATSVDS